MDGSVRATNTSHSAEVQLLAYKATKTMSEFPRNGTLKEAAVEKQSLTAHERLPQPFWRFSPPECQSQRLQTRRIFLEEH